MNDHISREAAIEAFDDPAVERNYGDVSPESVIRVIERIPAADVREVVYCRDCKFARFGPNWISCENFNGLCTNALGLGDFCSRSEKKEES